MSFKLGYLKSILWIGTFTRNSGNRAPQAKCRSINDCSGTIDKFLNEKLITVLYNYIMLRDTHASCNSIAGQPNTEDADTEDQKRPKSATLYDAGCGCAMAMVFGAAFSAGVGRYSWHYLIPPLYDAGGWFLIAIFFGIAFLGVVADYFWNYLILSLTLRWQQIDIMRKRRFVYIAIITVVGFLIDWLYYQFTWGTQVVVGSLGVSALFERPGLNPGLELSTILIPMALIGAVNYFASRFHLHLERKHAMVVGFAMAVFTAPWLIVAFVLLGW